MTDVSFLEYLVLAIVGYSGVIILIIAMIKDVPTSKASAGIRMIAAFPSMIANAALMGVGLKISFPITTTNSTTFLMNSTKHTLMTNSTTLTMEQPVNLILGPTWMLIHFALFLFLMLFIAIQILMIMTKTE